MSYGTGRDFGNVRTLKEIYCAETGCSDVRFAHRVFWSCLHGRARALAPLASMFRPDYFEPDRELIEAAGRARTMDQLDEEIRDYVADHRNLAWWRRRGKIRLSTRRLRSLARHALAANIREPGKAVTA